MTAIYLFFMAAVATPSFCQFPNCHHMQCNGPKFTRSICCEGFICVSSGHTGPPGMLMCVDKAKHLKVRSLSEIMSPQGPLSLPIQQQNDPRFLNQQLILANQLTNPYQLQMPVLRDISPDQQHLLVNNGVNSLSQGGFKNTLVNMNLLPKDPRLIQNMRVNPHFNGIQNNQGYPINLPGGGFVNNNALRLEIPNVQQQNFHQNPPNQESYIPPNINLNNLMNGGLNNPFSQVGFRSKTRSNLGNSSKLNESDIKLKNSTQVEQNQLKVNGYNSTIINRENDDNNHNSIQTPVNLKLRSRLSSDSHSTVDTKHFDQKNSTDHIEEIKDKTGVNYSKISIPEVKNITKVQSIICH